MHVGWVLLGEGHPLDPESNHVDELVNNERALTYARNLGVGWLSDCLDCDSASEFALSQLLYDTPKADPAPWYNAGFPDRNGFCGIFGVDVEGAEDSTLVATTVPNLRIGGTTAPSYRRPREIVIRALAVADSEAALQDGWGWYKTRINRRWRQVQDGQFEQEFCQGETLTFFHSCPPMECRPDSDVDPCPCDDMTTPGGPCWADTYAQLRDGPTCNPTWWPSTYGELKAGPPTDDEWCHWVYLYYELKLGADAWTCGSEFCVMPYIWQFYNCVITDGPKIVEHRKMPSVGAYFEIEMTITAGDPTPHRMKGRPGWEIN